MKAIGFAAAAAWFGPGVAPHVKFVADALRIERRLPVDGAVLSFDDGPHAEGTPAVLEVLRERGVRAIFFLVGEQVDRYPALAAEVAAAGHTVALHGYRHRNQMRLTPGALAEDIRRGVAAIGESTGQGIDLYRPPYGIFTPAGLALTRRAGWMPLLWSRWGRDWNTRVGAERIATMAARGAGAGDVILLHDADHYSNPGSWRQTAAALPLILDALEKGGVQPTVPASHSTSRARSHST